MNLFPKLQAREAAGRPIRVGLIGAGKFASMFLAQVERLPGLHVVGIADLNPAAAHANLARVGWPKERYAGPSLDDAVRTRATHVGADAAALMAHPGIEIIVESTGNPIAAVDHCLSAFRNGKHVVNVTVEADAFLGPYLARAAAKAGVIYSLAYGDQPALTCDLVDWARACGFPVIAAGRGHKWLPKYRESTPDTVWDHWGLTAEQARAGGLNPKMFNAFLDGSKPAIESSAIANATGLDVPSDGLLFPPGSIDDIPTLMRPKSDGGILERRGMVEVVSSLTLAGQPIPNDIRKGVWVAFEGDTEYIRRCFAEYMVTTDPSGRVMCLYKAWHLIGLELPISIASVGLRGEPTGVAVSLKADVVATAKRRLAPGEVLDGEGGYTVFGKLLPAKTSFEGRCLPLGLAHGIKLVRPVEKDQVLTWADVVADTTTTAYKARQEMEADFGPALAGEAQ